MALTHSLTPPIKYPNVLYKKFFITHINFRIWYSPFEPNIIYIIGVLCHTLIED